ncbi:MAG: hypothetical protein J2P46_12185, partial [Zavarzinella sp.]|nr:hypothetical protein [Zavarzinella sp.]
MPENDTNFGPPGQPYGGYPQNTPQSGTYAAAPTQQAVYTQPAPAAAPGPQTGYIQPVPVRVVQEQGEAGQLAIVSHSSLFYWWPVWVVGYLMCLATWLYGQPLAFDDTQVRLHPSNNLGVLYFLTLFLVILISSVTVRGLASVVVILAVTLAAVLLAYFRVWDDVFAWFGHLNIYLNQGAYFWFSTLMFLTWGLTTFVFDQMTRWVIKPGQITRENFWGAGSESYDTENMTLEKWRYDLFRHWLLGIGSGDLKIHTFGGRPEEIYIPNVLFVGYKIQAIQHLIAEKPD